MLNQSKVVSELVENQRKQPFIYVDNLQDLLILQSCVVQELMINGESALFAEQQPIIL